MQDKTMVEVSALCFDARDPLALARFWAEALRWELDERDPADIRLTPTDGTRFGIRFRPVPEPTPGPGRYHFDLTTSSLEDQQQSVARLLELGGRHLDIGQGPDATHVVLADPEGNELCIIEPQNRFLGDCDRLGALSGDGLRPVGCFWSEALSWPLVWDQDEETAIRAPDRTGPIISWGGPPVEPKRGPNVLHLDLAPLDGVETQAAVDHLVGLGARRLAPEDDGSGRVAMLDPGDNEFAVVPR